MRHHRPMNVIVLTALLGPLLSPGPGRSEDAPAARHRPNVVLIVADDLGFADVGFNGCKDIPTPNIDAIAERGVRFTQSYVSCPVCSPTRAGLMTGRYQQRFGHEFNPGPVPQVSPRFGLPQSETTLAERMKSAGYVTGIVGKWHLGLTDRTDPISRGFDEFFGFRHGSHSYVDARGDQLNPIVRGREAVDETEYLTFAFTREAVAFIERHQKEPFFLYLPYNAVHGPMQAPKDLIARFDHIEDRNRRTLAAMLTAMDDGIGKVMAALRKADLEEKTLIVFISDNGGPTSVNASRNDPYRGFKGQVYEGGIRVPMAAQWQRELPAGRVYDEPVISLDIYPTIIAAAGEKLTQDRPLDGVDLLPYLRGNRTDPPHEALFWRQGGQWAVRAGRHKLMQTTGGPVELFDLQADPGEDTNLAGDQPDLVRSLRERYKTWNAMMSAPSWEAPRRERSARSASGTEPAAD